MNIEAVIFDMDGVIIDSEPLWREAEITIFNNYNVQLTDEMCRTTAGLRLIQVVEHWQSIFDFKPDYTGEICKNIHQKVIDLILEKGKALSGLYELIHFFESKNITLALASGSSMQIIKTVIKKLQLEKVFQVIRSGDAEEFGKPHPSIFINTSKSLDISPMKCLVIEDSANGVIAAKAARMKVIAIPEAEVHQAPVFLIADEKIEHLKEIINLNYFK